MASVKNSPDCQELAWYRIDIAALSKMKITDEGSLCKPQGGYTFYWKGKAESEDRIHGIGLVIRMSLLHQLPGFPTGFNECLIQLHLPISSCHLTVISAYAPTLTSSDEDKEKLYEDIDRLIKSTPASDKLTLISDFNARVGRNSQCWE